MHQWRARYPERGSPAAPALTSPRRSRLDQRLCRPLDVKPYAGRVSECTRNQYRCEFVATGIGKTYRTCKKTLLVPATGTN